AILRGIQADIQDAFVTHVKSRRGEKLADDPDQLEPLATTKNNTTTVRFMVTPSANVVSAWSYGITKKITSRSR
ncbi:MAG: hypothetical protein AAGH65_11575, partial [Pseudomonadota bacterium]